MLKKEFDFIIVGAGSAGCVLANRLSQNPSNRVVLMEAGKHGYNSLLDSWKMKMPAALTYNLQNDKYNWDYQSTPQLHLHNRQIKTPRGKMLGGSSSLNAMVYIRGHPLDYDRWEFKEGAKGWSYANCLPYFKKAQSHILGENAYRGGNGPLNVSRAEERNAEEQVLSDCFIQAGIEAGYDWTDDLNGYQQEGFGKMDMTIHNGIRNSTYDAYLKPVLEKRENLHIMTDTLVEKIWMSNDMGGDKKAIGVQFKQDGKRHLIEVESEVIISAGAINSPQLLMLSGIGYGNSSVLDIPVLLDLPVGQNLQDHLEIYIQMACKQSNTLLNWASWKKPHKRIGAGLQWFYNQSGICASNHFETGGFIRSRAGIQHPNIQYHFLPGAVECQETFKPIHAFQAHCGTMRPKSRGYIQLQSPNPRDPPKIEFNYLQREEDITEFIEGIRLTQELFEQPSFQDYMAYPIFPDSTDKTDDELRTLICQHVESAYHPSSTCAMGKVVDESCRVYGTTNLRVVDASVMPSLVSGNLNAPTIMIAEKIADDILGHDPLEPEDPGFYVHSEWKTKQR